MSEHNFEQTWRTQNQELASGLAAKFISSPIEKRFIFGQNVYSLAIAENFPVAGIIDDFAEQSLVKSLDLFRLEEVPKDAIILNAVGGRTQSAKTKLDSLGFVNTDYFSFVKFCGLKLPEIVFNENFSSHFAENEAKFKWAHGQLSDEESKKIFEKLVSFRLTGDLEHLAGFKNREDEQYFEDFIHFESDHPVFIDVGGFDGFTSSEFIRKFASYGHVEIIEPEASNFEMCKAAFKNNPKVTVHNIGLGQKSESLRISSGGSASKVGPAGDQVIQIKTLDSLVKEQQHAPDFMKMDIEGYELQALMGSAETIKTHKPTLAISIYHHPNHFWQVPELILNIQDDYSVYLRHYTETIYESVMYFVPKNSVEQLNG